VHNLVYVAGGHEVKTEMVARKALVRDGEVLAADEATICDEAQVQADAVARRVTADPVHREMALAGATKAAWP
jgi:5-methylthioadenosine/S-adenosylhomocysteine deaminase